MKYKSISVIIPSYRDKDGLKETLKSIRSQNYPSKFFEIITILDVSPVGRARNEGVNRASNEIIAFIDSDMVAPNNWLSEINRLFSDERVDLAGSDINMFGGESLVETYDKLVGLPVSGILARQGYLITAGLVIRKKKLLELGAFREDIPVGEDTELGFRSKKAGLKPKMLSKVDLEHPAKKSLVKVVKREYLRGQAYAKLGLNWVLDNFSSKGFFEKMFYYLPKTYGAYCDMYTHKEEWINQSGFRKLSLYLFYIFLWSIKMISFFIFALLFWVESILTGFFTSD
jgi:glycosyltransferase involved in cell wall biosynthesis